LHSNQRLTFGSMYWMTWLNFRFEKEKQFVSL